MPLVSLSKPFKICRDLSVPRTVAGSDFAIRFIFFMDLASTYFRDVSLLISAYRSRMVSSALLSYMPERQSASAPTSRTAVIQP